MEEQLYYDIYQYLKNFIIPEEYNEQQINRIVQTAKHYFIEDNKLYRKNKNGPENTPCCSLSQIFCQTDVINKTGNENQGSHNVLAKGIAKQQHRCQ